MIHDSKMLKVTTTLTIDVEVLRAVEVRAARSGKSESEVIEEALRPYLGLDLLDTLWSRNSMDQSEGMTLAVEAQQATRRRKR